MTADRNNPGSRGEENPPRDPEVRDGDTRRLPAQTPTPDPASSVQPPTGPGGPGAYGGPYTPGGPGWTAPGWATTASGTTAPTTEHPRPGRIARLTHAARSKPLQITAAALIGALIGGGAVTVLDTIGDRHRAGNAFTRTDERRVGDRDQRADLDQEPSRDGWGDQNDWYGPDNGPDGSDQGRDPQSGSDGRVPGDGFGQPYVCGPTQSDLCTVPDPGPSTP
ncbi:hypothetical protein ACFOWE_04275 [Planomonospora corallina]|uniref:Uncharacterized protein n=1 Tax=Planomonospora corallina TaxID=1806052 RepID=A0ABV8I6D7_9ACTN